MSLVHILTETKRIETRGSQIYKITPREIERICQEEGFRLNVHINNLHCGRIDVEVEYPEIHDQETPNENGYLVIPEVLIPGRPYPIYIYVYAIAVYSFNPTMGQREAAKWTRERFGLKTFSHTTLGRAMIKLEKHIKEYENEEEDICEAKNPEEDVKVKAEIRRFPTVNQTKDRREKVAMYLLKATDGDVALTEEVGGLRKKPDYRCPPYTGAFINACHSIVGYTFLNYRRLLL